jgi:hypothetical protein
VAVNQKRVLNIARNNGYILHIDVVDIINNVNTFSLTRVGWFYDPNVAFGLQLLQFCKMRVEITKFVG